MSIKRLLSLVLVLCMVLSFFPASAFADVTEEAAPVEEQEPVAEEAVVEEPVVEENNVAEGPVVEEPAEEPVVEDVESDEESFAAAPALEDLPLANVNGTNCFTVNAIVEAINATAAGTTAQVELAKNVYVQGDIQISKPFSVTTQNGSVIKKDGNYKITVTGNVTTAVSIEPDIVFVKGGLTVNGDCSFGKVTVDPDTATPDEVKATVTAGTFASIDDCLIADGYYADNGVVTADADHWAAQIGTGANRVRYTDATAAADAAVKDATAPVLTLLKDNCFTESSPYKLATGKTLKVSDAKPITDEKGVQPLEPEKAKVKATHDVTNNITVYTTEDATFTVTFNGNSGTITFDDGDELTSYTNPAKAYGAAIHYPVSVARNGYELTGWSLNGGSELIETKALPKTCPAVDSVYTAQWSDPVTYTVTYTGMEGAENDPHNPTSYNVNSGTITLWAPKKAGSDFAGWYVEDTTTGKMVKTDVIAGEWASDLTLEARWTVHTYRFFAYSEYPESATVKLDWTRVAQYGEEIVAPPQVPEKENKEFQYWGLLNKKDLWIGGTKPTFTKVSFPFTLDSKFLDRAYVDNTDPESGYIRIYAIWKDDLYSVNYDAKGGTFTSSATNLPVSTLENADKKVGDAIAYAATDPVKTGYDFKGWLYEDGLVAPPAVASLPSIMPAENRNYVAQWQLVTKKITYTGGYVGPTAPNTYNVEQLPLTIPEQSLDGYTFKGYTCPKLNINNPVMELVIPAGTVIQDLEVSVAWDIVEYGIQFNMYDGKFKDGDPVYTSYNVEDAFTIPQPEKDGYIFAGWTGTGLTEPTKDVTIAKGTTGDLEFSANWEAKKVTVTINYNDNGGTKTDVYQVAYGTAINQPTTPKYAGHTLIGWSLKAGDPDPFAVNTFPYELESYAENVLLTGHWTTNKHTITLKANGSVFGANNKDTYEIPNVSFGEALYTNGWKGLTGLKDANTANYSFGYDFKGWTLEDGSELPETMPDEDLTVYAQYKAHVYKLYVNPNGPNAYAINPYTGIAGDAGKTISFEVPYGEKIPYPNVVREGCVFKAWVENYLGYAIPDKMPARDVGITAQWDGQASITFDADGGLVRTKALNNNPSSGTSHRDEVESYTAVIDVNMTENELRDYLPTAEPEKAGYQFESWVDETGKHWTQKRLEDLYTEFPATNKVFTANWTVYNYEVTFFANEADAKVKNPNTGNWVEKYSFQVPFGGKIEYPVEAVRPGYTFDGWYEAAIAEKPYGYTHLETMPAQNLWFFAQWKADVHTITLDANGGAFVNDLGEVSTKFEFTGEYGSDVSYAATGTLKLEGYTFVGWVGPDGVIANPPAKVPAKDVTYKALWKINEIQVTYMPRGGETVNLNTSELTKDNFTVTYKYGDKLVLPAATREGYAFAGWLEDIYGWNYPETVPDVASKKMTLRAIWVGEDYTLTFNANGGTVKTKALTSDPNNTTHVDEVPSYSTMVNAAEFTNVLNKLPLYEPERAGHQFESWVDEKEVHWTNAELNKLATAADFPNKDKVFTAQWKVLNYPVKFNADGGKVQNPNTGWYESEYYTQVPYGEKIPMPKDPVREGYSFVGWYETTKYGYNHPATMPNDKNGLEFKAIWKINQYTVTYDANGGIMETTALDSTTHVDKLGYYQVTGNFGDEMKNPTSISRVGYTFHGWVDQDGKHYADQQLPATIPAKNTYYVALWEINEYWVYFRPGTVGNRATIVNPITDVPAAKGAEVSFKVTYGEPIPYASISAPGYEFAGWVEDQLGYKLPETMPARLVGLTAKWKGLDYSFSFDANGGLVRTSALSNDPENWEQHEDKVPSYTAVYNVDSSEDYVLCLLPLDDPERAGYTFESWVDEDGKHWTSEALNDLAISKPLKDKSFVAEWKANPYTVTFNAAGGWVIDPVRYVRVPMFQHTYNFGDEIVYPANPTRVGYEFKGWIARRAEDNLLLGYVNPETMPAYNLVLWARWTPIPNTVVYNANGGTVLNKAGDPVEVLTIQAVSDAKIYVPEDEPERFGYEFKGWLDSQDNLHEAGHTAEFMPAAGETYTARWEPKVITVTFWRDFGYTESYATKQVKFGELLVPPVDPVYYGYNFEGWYTYRNDPDRLIDAFDFSQPILTEDDFQLVGKWSIALWTVTFDVNGGRNTVPDQIVQHNGKATLPQGMYRNGYEFQGWRVRRENGTLEDGHWNFETAVTKNLDLVADWKGKPVAIRWADRNVYMKDAVINVGDFIVRPEFEDYYFQQLIKDGRVENGVHYRLDPDDLWYPTPPERADEALNGKLYTLKWIKQVNFSYVDESGKLVTKEFDEGSKLSDVADSIALPGTRVYFTDVLGDEINLATPIADLMDELVYAHSVPAEFKVKFESEHGVVPEGQLVPYNSKAQDPGEMKDDLYTFVEWQLDGEKYDFNAPVIEDITLKAVWKETDVSHYATILRNLTLGDSIALNVYVDIKEGTKAEDYTVQAEFTNGEGHTTRYDGVLSNVAVLQDDGTYKMRFLPAAKEMTNIVSVAVQYKDKAACDAKELSVREYCEAYAERRASQPKVVNLCKAILDYGAYAQLNFGYKTGDLANKNLSSGVVETTAVPEVSYPSSGSCTGIGGATANLTLPSDFAQNAFFGVSGTVEASNYSFTVDGVPAAARFDGSEFRVSKTGIVARNLDKMISFKVTNNVDGSTFVFNDSPLAYLYRAYSRSNNINLVHLCSAIYLYNQAAIAYFA